MAFPISPIDGQVYGNYYYNETTETWKQINNRAGLPELIEKDLPQDVIVTANQELFELSTQDYISNKNRKPTLYRNAIAEQTEITDFCLNPNAWHLFPEEVLVDQAPTTGLMAYYSMRSYTGTAGAVTGIVDETGNYANAVAVNSPTIVSGPPSKSVLNLNGTNQYIELPDSLRPTGRNWTIAFLMNSNTYVSSDPRRFIFGGLATSSADSGVSFYSVDATTVKGLNLGTTGDVDRFFPLPAIKTGSWNHVVITCNNSGEIYIYVNGGIALKFTTLKLIPESVSWSTNKLRFGIDSALTVNRYFSGMLSEIRFYDHALTKEEVRQFTSRRVQVAGFWNEGYNLFITPDRIEAWTKGGSLTTTNVAGVESGYRGNHVTRVVNSATGDYLSQTGLAVTANKGAFSTLFRKIADTRFRVAIRNSSNVIQTRTGITFDEETPKNTDSLAFVGELTDYIWLEDDVVYYAAYGPITTATTGGVWIYPNLLNTGGADFVNSQLEAQAFASPFMGKQRWGGGLMYPRTLPNSGTVIAVIRTAWLFNEYPSFSRIFNWGEQVQSGTNWSTANMLNVALVGVSPTQTAIFSELRNSAGTIFNSPQHDLSSSSFFQHRHQWTQVALTWTNLNSGVANVEIKLYLNDTLVSTNNPVSPVSISSNAFSIGKNGTTGLSTAAGNNASRNTNALGGWISQVLIDDNQVWTQPQIEEAYHMWYSYGHKWYSPNRVIGKNYHYKKDSYGNIWPPA